MLDSSNFIGLFDRQNFALYSINHFLSLKIFLHACHFFLFLSSFIFITHLFRGLVGAYVNPRRFSLLVHSLACPKTHSFLDGFQPKVYSTSHTPFKKTLKCVMKGYYTAGDFCQSLDPQQMICINFQLLIYIDLSFFTESLKKLQACKTKL